MRQCPVLTSRFACVLAGFALGLIFACVLHPSGHESRDTAEVVQEKVWSILEYLSKVPAGNWTGHVFTDLSGEFSLHSPENMTSVRLDVSNDTADAPCSVTCNWWEWCTGPGAESCESECHRKADCTMKPWFAAIELITLFILCPVACRSFGEYFHIDEWLFGPEEQRRRFRNRHKFETPGADSKLIDRTTSIVSFQHSDHEIQSQSCTICLEEFQLGLPVRRLPCRHMYHVACVDEWLSQCRICPVCKHDIIA